MKAIIRFSYFEIAASSHLLHGGYLRNTHWIAMSISADILLMLAAFSLKAQFTAKAVIYSRAGSMLFPEDHRFKEILAYGLLLTEEFEEAESVIGQAQIESRNLAFLKTRLALLNGHMDSEGRNAIRTYLDRLDA